MTKTQTATQPQPTPMEIDQRTYEIDLMLEAAGLSRIYTSGSPELGLAPEEAGMWPEWNAKTGQIEIVDHTDIYAKFAFDAPIEQVREWIQARESESMIF